MRCLRPVRLNYTDEECKERMNNPNLDTFAKLQTYHLVPCGKCEFCLSQRRSDWSLRLRHEFDYSVTAYFITLTYDDSKLPINKFGFPEVNKRDIQLFLKRFRKAIQPFKIRYYIVSEYGPTTHRPHYHGIIFNFPVELRRRFDTILVNSWDKGFITSSTVNDARISYVTHYCLFSKENPSNTAKNFMLCSRRPLIGAGFVDRFRDLDYFNCNTTDLLSVRQDSGLSRKVRIPRIYREKLLRDDIKQQIVAKYDQLAKRDFTELHNKQAEWLIEHGYNPALKLCIEGSPMWEYLQAKQSKADSIRKLSKKRSKHI